MKTALAILLTILLAGCAELPHQPPVGISEGGMRMPTDQACYIKPATTSEDAELMACNEVWP